MTRRVKHSRHSRHSRHSKRSRTRSKQTKRFRGGAQGALLAQAFSGVVLPPDVYRPILKPMHGGAHGGDGVAYQDPIAHVATKGYRARGKRSVKRRGKVRMVPGHALPVGFGQMVQSFRPL